VMALEHGIVELCTQSPGYYAVWQQRPERLSQQPTAICGSPRLSHETLATTFPISFVLCEGDQVSIARVRVSWGSRKHVTWRVFRAQYPQQDSDTDNLV